MNIQNKMTESLRNVELANQEYVNLMECMAKNKIWVMRSAQKTLKISDMTTIHIENALYVAKRALRHGFESDIRRDYYKEIIPCLENELLERSQFDDDEYEDYEDDEYLEDLEEDDPFADPDCDECCGCCDNKSTQDIEIPNPILDLTRTINKMRENLDKFDKLESNKKEFENLASDEKVEHSKEIKKEKNAPSLNTKTDEKELSHNVRILSIDLTKDSPKEIAKKIAEVLENPSNYCTEKSEKDEKAEKDFVESVIDNIMGQLL